MPLCYCMELAFPSRSAGRVYQMVSTAYCGVFLGSALVHTKAGHRVRSLWRKKHLQHIGNPSQLAVPFETWLTYTLFWIGVLTIKLLFGYFMLVKPLRKPLEGLVQHPFPRIEVGEPQPPGPAHALSTPRTPFPATLPPARQPPAHASPHRLPSWTTASSTSSSFTRCGRGSTPGR